MRYDVSPKRRERKPSRQRANDVREPAVAVPSALAKALGDHHAEVYGVGHDGPDVAP